MAGCNVQKDELVGTLLFVAVSHLNGIPGILQVDEIHSLNHSARVYVKTRNDTLRQHGGIRES
jgi:hypothetical protein